MDGQFKRSTSGLLLPITPFAPKEECNAVGWGGEGELP